MWRRRFSSAACSGSIYQIIIRFGWNTLEVSRKVVLEAQDIPRHGSGDRLENRFGHTMNIYGYHDWMPLDKPKWPSQSPGVRADAQCYHITWLEELASESNIIQAQEDICQQGKSAGKYHCNYIYVFDGLSSISLDVCVRLG